MATEYYFRVASVDEIPEGGMLEVRLAGKVIVLAKVDGVIFAVGGRCTHQPVFLDTGILTEFTLECPWHGGQFDIRTGDAIGWPCTDPLPTYPVQIEGDDILIGVT